MIINAYTIFDTASGAYMRPFFLLSDSQATRSFTDIATDAEHEVGKHPEDYSLVRIGTFNDSKGQFAIEDVSVLATGLEVVASSRSTAGLRKFQEQFEGADAPANGQQRNIAGTQP